MGHVLLSDVSVPQCVCNPFADIFCVSSLRISSVYIMSFCIIFGGPPCHYFKALFVTFDHSWFWKRQTHKNKSAYQAIMAKLYFFFMIHQTHEHPIQVFFLATSIHSLILVVFKFKLLKILLRFNNTNGGDSELSVPESNTNWRSKSSFFPWKTFEHLKMGKAQM